MIYLNRENVVNVNPMHPNATFIYHIYIYSVPLIGNIIAYINVVNVNPMHPNATFIYHIYSVPLIGNIIAYIGNITPYLLHKYDMLKLRQSQSLYVFFYQLYPIKSQDEYANPLKSKSPKIIHFIVGVSITIRFGVPPFRRLWRKSRRTPGCGSCWATSSGPKWCRDPGDGAKSHGKISDLPIYHMKNEEQQWKMRKHKGNLDSFCEGKAIEIWGFTPNRMVGISELMQNQ